MAMPSVSAVIPMHNEAPYVQRCLDAVTNALSALGGEYEVVVVDDASTDGTGDLVDAYARQNPRVRCVRNETNLTLGGTLRHGFSVARMELVFYTDADLPFDVGLVEKAVRLLRFQEADLVVAYRFTRTEEGVLRTVYSFFYNTLVRLLLKVRVRDINFSFKLFRRSMLPALELKSGGSFIDAELVAKAIHRGYRLIQFGVDYFPRSIGVSKLSSFGTIARILREFLRLRGETVRRIPRDGNPS